MPTTHLTLGERYRAREQLSGTALVSTWAGDDLARDVPVAITVLARRLQEDRRAVDVFEREAEAAATLSDDPHALRIHEVGRHEKGPAIVCELLAGRTLRAVLAEPDLVAPADAVRWLGQVASVLDAAHARGVVHGDVRPANLHLDGRGSIVVSDFGLARVAHESDLVTLKSVLGTAAYLSPEQVLEEPATGASDRYALAVVAYELLTGALPYDGRRSFGGMAQAHLDGELVPTAERRAGLPAGLDEVLRRGLEREPRARWPTASAFAEAVDEAFGA